jgi:branched-chain amino acid transport system ATP-binding protein
VSGEALLDVAALEVRYGALRAVVDVSLRVARGELLAIVGANGAGKTTLIRAIAGMLRPASGSIRFAGQEIAGLETSRTCELGIGQVAEGRQIFPLLSVRENLHLGGALRRARARRSQNFDKVFTMFPRLAERQRQKAGTLSGGEQQMLAIGRCLMAEPELIMFDEPSLGLSPLLVEQMFAVIAALKAAGQTILLVEQNVGESLALADRAAVLENGMVVLSGSGEAIAGDARVKSAYLGL